MVARHVDCVYRQAIGPAACQATDHETRRRRRSDTFAAAVDTVGRDAVVVSRGLPSERDCRGRRSCSSEPIRTRRRPMIRSSKDAPRRLNLEQSTRGDISCCVERLHTDLVRLAATEDPECGICPRRRGDVRTVSIEPVAGDARIVPRDAPDNRNRFGLGPRHAQAPRSGRRSPVSCRRRRRAALRRRSNQPPFRVIPCCVESVNGNPVRLAARKSSNHEAGSRRSADSSAAAVHAVPCDANVVS